MTTIAWRFVKAKYQNKAFAGEGAQKFPGRWNTAAFPMVYTSSAVSLAVLELLAYIEDASLLASYLLFRADLGDSLMETLQDADLPSDWRSVPAPDSTKTIGDTWFHQGRSAVLSVPSAVVPLERNYLINPVHRDFRKIKLSGPVDFEFEPRLMQLVRP